MNAHHYWCGLTGATARATGAAIRVANFTVANESRVTAAIKFAAGITVGNDADSVRTPGQPSKARRSNVTAATLAAISLKMTGSRAAARRSGGPLIGSALATYEVTIDGLGLTGHRR
jgi:hypothetical protein